jgi:hypothetical protein
MKTHEKMIGPDELPLPVYMLSNGELAEEYTRLTGEVALPANALDPAERLGWRLGMERKVKVARRWHDINIRF